MLFDLAVPLILLAVVLHIGLIALAMWIGYRLVIVAVRTAILEADDERERRSLQRQQ